MARNEKVAEAIRKEVSTIIHDELKDPRLGFITITNVEVTADLRYAKIFFSVLGNDDDYAKTKKALDSGLGFIRKLIGERIQLRFVPELSFREDRSSEYSVRIQKVLDEIKELDSARSNQNDRRTSISKEKNEPKKTSRKPKKKK
ncbi:MAG: 30S ribosome-binding factor RbfA [Candidatus Omnitrophica bacterium]|nr:30S ribosome-binding factor RbfA [Candidatus Omnitrophota bacterium]